MRNGSPESSFGTSQNSGEEVLLSIEFISGDSRLDTSTIAGKRISEFASQDETGAIEDLTRVRLRVKVVNVGLRSANFKPLCVPFDAN